MIVLDHKTGFDEIAERGTTIATLTLCKFTY
jgi:hypothetical protein